MRRTGRPSRSPGASSGSFPKEANLHCCPQSIYSWIKRDEDREHWESFLRRRGKRRSRRKNPHAAERARIDARPETIEQRARLGDFEGDTVLGPPGTGGLTTLVDRNSRYSLLSKIESKDADHVHQHLKRKLELLAPAQRHSITFDNGTEFAHCERLEKHLGIEIYWADPAVRISVVRTKIPTG